MKPNVAPEPHSEETQPDDSIEWRSLNATLLYAICSLVRETLPIAETPYVELSAVMAKYNPFAEKAGMRKIAEQPPPKQALKVAEVLRQLGFNIDLLGSQKTVLNKLQCLSDKEIHVIKETFIRHSHTRFMKCFFCHMPFGKKQAYAEEVGKASFERLAHLIKVCGFLLQMKVYLFWNSNYPQSNARAGS